MPKENKNHILYILDYIWKNSDSEHYVTINEIIDYLNENGISANRKTVAADIAELTEYGFKIELERSTQNRYRFELRRFELPELKCLSMRYRHPASYLRKEANGSLRSSRR